MSANEKANLGLATTEELLGELRTRLEMERYVRRMDDAPIRIHGKPGGLHVAVDNLTALLTPEQLAYRSCDEGAKRPRKLFWGWA